MDWMVGRVVHLWLLPQSLYEAQCNATAVMCRAVALQYVGQLPCSVWGCALLCIELM